VPGSRRSFSAVTGSAATGAFIQLPGAAARRRASAALEIKDRDEELKGWAARADDAPAGRPKFPVQSAGPVSRGRPGGVPKPGAAGRS
jgi:hypothetical protein